MFTENPYGEEPDEDDFDRWPLPLCFDEREELKQLNIRKMKIEREWQKAEERTGNWAVLVEYKI